MEPYDKACRLYALTATHCQVLTRVSLLHSSMMAVLFQTAERARFFSRLII